VPFGSTEYGSTVVITRVVVAMVYAPIANEV
jgi:hypothetical protein